MTSRGELNRSGPAGGAASIRGLRSGTTGSRGEILEGPRLVCTRLFIEDEACEIEEMSPRLRHRGTQPGDRAAHLRGQPGADTSITLSDERAVASTDATRTKSQVQILYRPLNLKPYRRSRNPRYRVSGVRLPTDGLRERVERSHRRTPPHALPRKSPPTTTPPPRPRFTIISHRDLATRLASSSGSNVPFTPGRASSVISV